MMENVQAISPQEKCVEAILDNEPAKSCDRLLLSAEEVKECPTAPGDSIGKGLLVAPKMQQSVQLIVLQFEESDDKIAIFSRYSIRTEELREIIVVRRGGEGACKANWLQGCEWDVTSIR